MVAYDEAMKPRVYLETTIPSYLTAWPSRDLVRAAHQQITRDWWDRRRAEFELYRLFCGNVRRAMRLPLPSG